MIGEWRRRMRWSGEWRGRWSEVEGVREDDSHELRAFWLDMDGNIGRKAYGETFKLAFAI